MSSAISDEKLSLQFSVLLDIFSAAFLRSHLTGLMSIFYHLYFLDSLNLEGQVPVFVFPRNRVA
jgi:hypothetical protein